MFNGYAPITTNEQEVHLIRSHHAHETAWLMLQYAFSQGYATRIGREDTLLLPDGQIALDNVELVQAAYGFGVRSAR